MDRVIEQAITQVLSLMFELLFSEYSLWKSGEDMNFLGKTNALNLGVRGRAPFMLFSHHA